MPNHVTSRMIVTGPEADLSALRSLIVRPAPDDHSDAGAPMFDFDAVIPMPSILHEAEASSKAEIGASLILYRADRAAPYADHAEFWSKSVREELGMQRDSISEVASAYLAAHPDCEAMGRKRLQAILETGFASWYPWAVETWGTKWGAYRYHEDERQPGRFAFQFETAWSFPKPIFSTLAQRFPALTFDCVCFDEGWNFAGEGTFVGNGGSYVEGTATDELYERVYGRKPEHDEEDDDA